eukprot:6177092-Pleurochrysis_carterae.AAC.3
MRQVHKAEKTREGERAEGRAEGKRIRTKRGTSAGQPEQPCQILNCTMAPFVQTKRRSVPFLLATVKADVNRSILADDLAPFKAAQRRSRSVSVRST